MTDDSDTPLEEGVKVVVTDTGDMDSVAAERFADEEGVVKRSGEQFNGRALVDFGFGEFWVQETALSVLPQGGG